MSNFIDISRTIFSKKINHFGEIQLRYLDLEEDIATIHNWVTTPHAKYWGMQNMSLEEVKTAYEELEELDYYEVFIGMYKNKPIFLMEKYKASKDRIANYYEVESGDYGMHILVSPPTKKIPSFTWNVFTTILDYFFSKTTVNRIVVEPDVNNQKIHVLNKKAGFQYIKEIELPEKRAAFAFCNRIQYEQACIAQKREKG